MVRIKFEQYLMIENPLKNSTLCKLLMPLYQLVNTYKQQIIATYIE